MIVFLTYVLITSILLILYYQYERRKYISECLRIFKGPPPKFLVGNALDFGVNPNNKLQDLKQMQDKYGPICKFFIGPTGAYLLVSDPQLVEVLLSSQKHLRKGADYKIISPWLFNGLLLSEGNYWQKRRKIITPTFHFKILDNFLPIFNEESDVLVQKLLPEVGKDVVNIYPFITAFALDSICETAMGTTVNAQSSPNNKYINAVRTLCSMFTNRKFSPWKKNDFLFQFSSDFKTQSAALNIIHGFTRSVIEKRRNDLMNQGMNKEMTDDTEVKNKTAFLDLLLKATVDGEGLSDADIMEEVETFMFANTNIFWPDLASYYCAKRTREWLELNNYVPREDNLTNDPQVWPILRRKVYENGWEAYVQRKGHDTTASAICFTLYAIAHNPNIQDKIIEELKDIFTDDGNRQPSMQDFNNMKYLDLVIKEAMRMYPPVPYFSRELEEDLEYKRTVIPKGVTVTVFTYHMHNRPELFKNPDEFLPERFLYENLEPKNNFAYIPFSGGPRNCIGQKYAMFEMKAVLSKILRNFNVLAADPKYNVVLSGEIVLKTAAGVSIRLEKRQF